MSEENQVIEEPQEIVEQPEPVEPEQPEGEQPEGEQPEGEQSQEPQQKKTARERIVELARQRAEATRAAQAERERAAKLEELLMKQNEILQKQLNPQQDQQQSKPLTLPNGEPNPEAYEYGRFDPAYLQAVVQYNVDVQVQQRIEIAQRIQAQQAFEAKEAEFRASHPDYDAARETLLLDPVVSNSPILGQAVASSAVPAALIYHLGGHPEVAQRLANMPPLEAARMIGVIEAVLQAQQTNQPQAAAPQKPVTKTTSPVGTARSAGVSWETRTGDYDEYKRLREAQKQHRKMK